MTTRTLEKLVLALVGVSILLGNLIWMLSLRTLYLCILAAMLAFGAFMWLGRTLLHSREKKYTDPYDLDLLREIDEREALRSAAEQRVEGEANVLCPHCGNLYAHYYKVCPQCRRAP